MNASRSSIDAAYKSLDPFSPDNMALGQKFTEGNSGLIAWLRTDSRARTRVSPQPRLLVERIGLFPSSGDVRCTVANPMAILEHLRLLYASKALDADESDGLRLTFAEWRFKVCLSPAQSEILLNVESRGDVVLMQLKTAELLAQIDEKSGSES